MWTVGLILTCDNDTKGALISEIYKHANAPLNANDIRIFSRFAISEMGYIEYNVAPLIEFLTPLCPIPWKIYPCVH